MQRKRYYILLMTIKFNYLAHWTLVDIILMELYLSLSLKIVNFKLHQILLGYVEPSLCLIQNMNLPDIKVQLKMKETQTLIFAKQSASNPLFFLLPLNLFLQITSKTNKYSS